jgi:polyhydroxybutyrate depolymerase
MKLSAFFPRRGVSQILPTVSALLVGMALAGIAPDTQAVTCALNTTVGEHRSALDDSMGNQRVFLYKIPTGYNPNAPNGYPIIFSFHGAGSSALLFADRPGQVRMRELADSRDFILVYPQGGLPTASGTPSCPPEDSFFPRALWEGITTTINSADVQFVEELYTYLAASLNIDAGKVYAAGFSNGGMFTHRLGGERSDRFTAIAAVNSTAGARRHITANGPAGPIDYWTVPLVPPKPERTPVPVLMMNSASDPITPYNGGITLLSGLLGLDLYSNGENWSHWYEANNCDVLINATLGILTSTGVTGVFMSNQCKSTYFAPPLVSIVFNDLGATGPLDDHRWPDLVTDGYDASEVIVDFLLTFAK